MAITLQISLAMTTTRLAALLLSLSMVTGCATTTGKVAGGVAGGVAAGALALGALSMSDDPCRDDCADARLIDGVVLGGAALVALVVAAVAEGHHHEPALRPSGQATSTTRSPATTFTLTTPP